MDFLTLIGVLLAFTAILLGNYLEGGAWHLLVNIPALVVVLGGSLGAAVMQTPAGGLKRALRLLVWALKPPVFSVPTTLKKVLTWSTVARKRGLLGLESLIAQEHHPFVKKGLQMLVDGVAADKLRVILEKDIALQRDHHQAAAGFYESMGGYAPTIGIMGAVMGLMHVMGNLGEPSALGPALAVAFVATLYGVGFANLVCLPLAHKLLAQADRVATWQQLILEGLVAIAEGENPKNIEFRLSGYPI
jgi:chemotaxis protein MotA